MSDCFGLELNFKVKIKPIKYNQTFLLELTQFII